MTSNMSEVRFTNSFGSSLSSGGFASTTGFGLYSHASELCSRCSRSRTEEKYWSIRSWSFLESERWSRFAWPATKSSVLCPWRSASTLASTSLALPCTKSFSKSLRGLRSALIVEPLRVKESVCPPSLLIASVSDG